MIVRLEQEMRGVAIDPDTLPQAFELPGLVRVTFGGAFDDAPPQTHLWSVRCESRIVFKPPVTLLRDFLALSERRLPEGSAVDPAHWGAGPAFIDGDGRLKEAYAPHSVLPQRLRDAAAQLHGDLADVGAA